MQKPHEEMSFLENMAQQLQNSAATIYSEPVERHGVTVIPVAKLRFGFGGGSGNKAEGETGTGGGGGVQAMPFGYIELRNGKSRFHRFQNVPFLLGRAVQILAGIGVFWWLAKRLPRGREMSQRRARMHRAQAWC